MLEEASMLTQTGNEVTGYKDLARMLKKHLQQFTSQLEATRERIEGTAQCYHLLDKVGQYTIFKKSLFIVYFLQAKLLWDSRTE